MPLSSIILILFVSVFTAAAAVIDYRTRRIPNFLTIPAFLAGIVFQIAFHWHEPMRLLDPVQGFAVGFGTLFVLWIIGGGGGGDVKLMGALSVWLGFRMTLYVLILSTVFVVIGTGAVILLSTMTRGFRKTKNKYLSKSITEGTSKAPVIETLSDRQGRRLMTYALPVALACWVVLAWMHLKP